MGRETQSRAILRAISDQNEGAVRRALADGADARKVDGDGSTPLHLASMTSNKTTIPKLLIKSGADVNAKDDSGQTPLHRGHPFRPNIP